MPTVTGDVKRIAGTTVTSGEVRFTATTPVVQDPNGKTTSLATSVAEHVVTIDGTGSFSTTLPATGDTWVYRVEISAYVDGNRVQGLPRLLLEVPASGADLSDAGVDGAPSGRVVINRLVGATELSVAVAPIAADAAAAEAAAVAAAADADRAEQTVTDYEPRITGIEAMAGLTPETPVDGQTSNLISNESTLTRTALNAANAEAMAARGMVSPNLYAASDVVTLGINASQAVSGLASMRSFILEVVPGEVYSLSRPVVEGNRFRVAFTDGYPVAGMATVDYVAADSDLAVEGLVVPADVTHMLTYLSSESFVPTSLKVERGATATQYSPEREVATITATARVVDEKAPVVTVGPSGEVQVLPDWDGATGTDYRAEIQHAIDVAPVGGVVELDLRGGNVFCGDTLTLAKPLTIRAGAVTRGDNAVYFPVDVTGLHVDVPSSGGNPSDWALHYINLRGVPTTRQATGETGFGVFVEDGRGDVDKIFVEDFSNHGVYIRAGSQWGGGNATRTVLDKVSVRSTWGDGIHLNGTDVQACLLIKPDVMSCAGWGLNIDTANINEIIAPHFDQRSRNSPGIIRDLANSNRYGFIYAEPGGTEFPNSGRILLDKDDQRESSYAYFETAGYAGNVWFDDQTTGRSHVYWDRMERSWSRRTGIHSVDEQHYWRQEAGTQSLSGWRERYVPGPGSAYAEKDLQSYNRGTDRRVFHTMVDFNDAIRLPVFATADRPAAGGFKGRVIMDGDLNMPLVSNGVNWRHFDGTAA